MPRVLWPIFPNTIVQFRALSPLAEFAARIRRLAGRSAWSVAEQFANPVLMLVSTPVLVRSLGADGFGLWMLANTVAALGIASNLGMGAAATRFVASARGAGESQRCEAFGRLSLGYALLGALVLGGSLAALAPVLAATFFGKMGDPALVEAAIRMGSLVLLLQQLDLVFSGVMRGMERFAMAARLELAARLLTFLMTVSAALHARAMMPVLWALAAGATLSLVLKAGVLARLVGWRYVVPAWSGPEARALLGFGWWNWIHGVSSALFQHVDRLLVGSLLGSASLGHYAIGAQLAQLVHALPASAMSVLMPATSRKLATGPGAPLGRLKWMAMAANVMLVAAVALPLVVFGRWFLGVWVGAEAAAEAGPVLLILVAAYTLLGLNIAPFLMLLGAGHARYISLTNFLGGLASIAATVLLVPSLGLAGAAFARLLYGPIQFLNLIPFIRRL